MFKIRLAQEVFDRRNFLFLSHYLVPLLLSDKCLTPSIFVSSNTVKTMGSFSSMIISTSPSSPSTTFTTDFLWVDGCDEIPVSTSDPDVRLVLPGNDGPVDFLKCWEMILNFSSTYSIEEKAKKFMSFL